MFKLFGYFARCFFFVLYNRTQFWYFLQIEHNVFLCIFCATIHLVHLTVSSSLVFLISWFSSKAKTIDEKLLSKLIRGKIHGDENQKTAKYDYQYWQKKIFAIGRESQLFEMRVFCSAETMMRKWNDFDERVSVCACENDIFRAVDMEGRIRNDRFIATQYIFT